MTSKLLPTATGISAGLLALLPLATGFFFMPAQAADTAVEISSVTTDNDSVTLSNTSNQSTDLSGYTISDDKDGDQAYEIPAGTELTPGSTLLVSHDDSGTTGFEFGISNDDTIYLFNKDGQKVNEYSVKDSAHAAGQQWPGSQDLTDLDSTDNSRSEWSGLDYQPSAGDTPGVLWAVENGSGTLYRLKETDSGWNTVTNWNLRYPDGSGTIDSEGVTAADDGHLYVSSERNTDDPDTSRPSVLKYDISSDSGELSALQEWDLTSDFPDLDPNAGLEGITWVPDSYLTENGFIDQNTGETYAPENYPGHGNGLFAVAVEGTSGVYLYALHDDGTAEQIAAINTDLDPVVELEFDAAQGGLWVVCDENCDGATATYSINSGGTFEQTALYARPSNSKNYANEGFTIADTSRSENGEVPTYYVDDSNTDGHSLRQGSLTLDSAGSTGSAQDSRSTAGPGILLPLGIGAGILLILGAISVKVFRTKR